MQENENNIIEGWTIHPPENTHKARRWIKTIETMTEPVNPPGNRQSDNKVQHQELFRLW